jgi:hypothetical protein
MRKRQRLRKTERDIERKRRNIHRNVKENQRHFDRRLIVLTREERRHREKDRRIRHNQI